MSEEYGNGSTNMTNIELSSASRSQRRGEIRGMRGPYGKGDSSTWLKAVSKFPNGVPRFESREACEEFMKKYNYENQSIGSNPDYPHLMHIFTMLVSWDQIESYLLPEIKRARMEAVNNQSNSNSPMNINRHTNVYELDECKQVLDEIEERLNYPFHVCTNQVSTYNTLKYLFHHMKCGIFIMIRNGDLRIFAPFVNKDYRNTWGDVIKLEGDDTLDSYYTQKSGLYREEIVEVDRTKWWANGNIICNELTKKDEETQFWGDHFLAPLRDMLGEACRLRNMPDCEFFLNKRDYPQLKVNPEQKEPVEPYGFIWDKDDRDPSQDIPLHPRHKYKTYAPIVSFYAAAPTRFSDIPWPSSEDWEAACGEVFPNTFQHRVTTEGSIEFDTKPRDLFTEANFRKFERSWDDGRVATAFFRGTATGGGTTIYNNQRLMVAHLSNEWKNDPEKGGNEPFLDAAIVGWNLRDKKISEGPMTFLRQTNFDFTAGKHHFTPIYEQSKYKYLVYVDGHCAACRYGFMMRLGSVILKVLPRQVADTMWYFPLLKPYVDHVPVKADLSDLEEKIRWCRENDEKCRQIGENAKLFYQKYVARDALLDYVQAVCNQISKRYIDPPDWYNIPPREELPPKLRKPDVKCYEDKKSNKSRFCIRCKESEEEEQKRISEQEERKEGLKEDSTARRKRYRERMRKKVKPATK